MPRMAISKEYNRALRLAAVLVIAEETDTEMLSQLIGGIFELLPDEAWAAIEAEVEEVRADQAEEDAERDREAAEEADFQREHSVERMSRVAGVKHRNW